MDKFGWGLVLVITPLVLPQIAHSTRSSSSGEDPRTLYLPRVQSVQSPRVKPEGDGRWWGKFGFSHRTPTKTRCHPGPDPGSISRWYHSREVGGAGRPGGVGRNLEMGPGLRRGDTGGGVSAGLEPMARSVESPRVRPEGDGWWVGGWLSEQLGMWGEPPPGLPLGGGGGAGRWVGRAMGDTLDGVGLVLAASGASGSGPALHLGFFEDAG